MNPTYSSRAALIADANAAGVPILITNGEQTVYYFPPQLQFIQTGANAFAQNIADGQGHFPTPVNDPTAGGLRAQPSLSQQQYIATKGLQPLIDEYLQIQNRPGQGFFLSRHPDLGILADLLMTPALQTTLHVGDRKVVSALPDATYDISIHDYRVGSVFGAHPSGTPFGSIPLAEWSTWLASLA